MLDAISLFNTEQNRWVLPW